MKFAATATFTLFCRDAQGNGTGTERENERDQPQRLAHLGAEARPQHLMLPRIAEAGLA